MLINPGNEDMLMTNGGLCSLAAHTVFEREEGF